MGLECCFYFSWRNCWELMCVAMQSPKLVDRFWEPFFCFVFPCSDFLTLELILRVLICEFHLMHYWFFCHCTFSLQILERVKTTYDIPIVTDVHESTQVGRGNILSLFLHAEYFVELISYFYQLINEMWLHLGELRLPLLG